MRKLLILLWNQNSFIVKAFIFILCAVIIVMAFPTEGSYNLEYKSGKPWMHNDVITNFDFSILKTEDEIKLEKEELLLNVKPYYTYDSVVYAQNKATFINQVEKKYKFEKALNVLFKSVGIQLLDIIYDKGIVKVEENYANNDSINLIDGHLVKKISLKTLFTIRSADEFLRYSIQHHNDTRLNPLLPILQDVLDYNIVFNKKYTEKERNEIFKQLALTHGFIQQGEKIVSLGELITPEKNNILKSYNSQYQKNSDNKFNSRIVLFGQFCIVAIALLLLVLFLAFLRKDIFDDNKKIILILLMLVISVVFTGFVVDYNTRYIFLVPICIGPIIMRVFFDTRLATYVHNITIVVAGLMVPNGFEFVFLQLVTGVIVIVSMLYLQRRGQFIIAGVLVFISYSITYTAYKLMQGTSLHDLNLGIYLQFAANGAFTLMAYPLIFVYERIFGFVTDVSLMELSDTNSKLLRELSRKAPGTFQHSLRVANISEEIMYQINGKTLLVRTGAMYHDIGKMENPLYFVENQMPGVNPHDDISYDESARVIINHVLHGIEKARKYNLPEQVIDFIRTHHGTTKARYFYVLQLKENSNEAIDEKAFTYHGPVPFSRETAVLMLTDAVEAASRSLKQPNEQSVNDLVDNIINAKIEQQQLVNSNLTFKDISIIKKILKKQLLTIFHIRIEYPEFSK